MRSSPASCIASRRAAFSALAREVELFFFRTRTADGDDTDCVIAVSDKSRPRSFLGSSDYQPSQLVQAAGWDLQPVCIFPNCLRLVKVDPVFWLCSRPISLGRTRTASGIKIIPLQGLLYSRALEMLPAASEAHIRHAEAFAV